MLHAYHGLAGASDGLDCRLHNAAAEHLLADRYDVSEELTQELLTLPVGAASVCVFRIDFANEFDRKRDNGRQTQTL